jgi:hypothetical protein
MPITLNHTIVPSHNKEQSAQFFARMFGLDYAGPVGHFAQVRVNGDLALDWDNRDRFESHHYAFVVNDRDFDDIFGRLKSEGVAYGSGPGSPTDGDPPSAWLFALDKHDPQRHGY